MKKSLPYIIIALSLALIALGLFRGEADLIHSAGSGVCMECVGLG